MAILIMATSKLLPQPCFSDSWTRSLAAADEHAQCPPRSAGNTARKEPRVVKGLPANVGDVDLEFPRLVKCSFAFTSVPGDRLYYDALFGALFRQER